MIIVRQKTEASSTISTQTPLRDGSFERNIYIELKELIFVKVRQRQYIFLDSQANAKVQIYESFVIMARLKQKLPRLFRLKPGS